MVIPTSSKGKSDNVSIGPLTVSLNTSEYFISCALIDFFFVVYLISATGRHYLSAIVRHAFVNDR